MKELKEFTVERLEELSNPNIICKVDWDERVALAKIALAAKQATPAYWITYYPNANPDEFDDREHSHSGPESCARKIAKEFGGHVVPVFYGTPPLSNPCIKCNDTGIADSGGTQPWGEPISIECDCATPPLNHTEHDGWVKCSERMPERKVEVIVITSTGERWIAHLNWISGRWDDGDFYDDIQNVTHWMPLPAAPKPEM